MNVRKTDKKINHIMLTQTSGMHTTVENLALKDFTSLTSLTLSKGLRNASLLGCVALKSLTFQGGIESVKVVHPSLDQGTKCQIRKVYLPANESDEPFVKEIFPNAEIKIVGAV